MIDFKTNLFYVHSNNLSLTELLEKDTSFLDDYMNQLTYVLDVVKHGIIKADTTDNEIRVHSDSLNFSITDIDLNNNTCKILYDDFTYNAVLETYNGYISALVNDEVFCILPFSGGAK